MRGRLAILITTLAVVTASPRGGAARMFAPRRRCGWAPRRST